MTDEEKKEEERFVVDAEKGRLVLNGGPDGTISNKMIEDGIRELIADAHRRGIERPRLESVVISSKAKVLLADVFCTLGENKDIDISGYTLISESGDWEISPNRGLNSPFVGMEKPPKAFIFNSKIPKGMEVLRDGVYQSEGILEGIGKALVFGVNVNKIPERAFANSDISYFNVNASDEVLRIGKEAFLLDRKGRENDFLLESGDEHERYLNEEKIKKLVGILEEFTTSQNERYAKQIINLNEEKTEVQSKINSATTDEQKEEFNKDLAAIDKSLKQAFRKQRIFEKIGLEYDHSRLEELISEGVERLEDDIPTLSLHNVSSDFGDKAFLGNKNLFISYQEGFDKEMQTRLADERNRIEKASIEAGLSDDEKECLITSLKDKEPLPDSISEKINTQTYASLLELVECNERIKTAGENGSLLLTTYGCALGYEVIKDSGVTAVINARGENSTERLAIERSATEKRRETIEDFINFRLANKGKPEIIDESLERMKAVEEQIKKNDERIANVRLKDRSLAGAENLSVVDIDTDGSVKDLLKDSGTASGGIVFPGEKKIVSEDSKEKTRWKANPLEKIGSYMESWETVRKMSITDQLFDILKNLLLLSSSGLVLGIKKAIETEEPNVVFEIEPKLFIRDEILKREVTFSTPSDWEEYGRIRDKYQAENKKIKELYERKEKTEIELAIMKRDLNKEYRNAVVNLFFTGKEKTSEKVIDVVAREETNQAKEDYGSDVTSTIEGNETATKLALKKDKNNEDTVEVKGINEDGNSLKILSKDIQARINDFAVFKIVLQGYLSNISGENLNESRKNDRDNFMLSLIEENFGEEEKAEFKKVSSDKERIKEKLESYILKTESAYSLGELLVRSLKELKEPYISVNDKDSISLFFTPALLSSSTKDRDDNNLQKEKEVFDISRYETIDNSLHTEKIHER